jgi:hypothetical protein
MEQNLPCVRAREKSKENKDKKASFNKKMLNWARFTLPIIYLWCRKLWERKRECVGAIYRGPAPWPLQREYEGNSLTSINNTITLLNKKLYPQIWPEEIPFLILAIKFEDYPE